MTIITFGDSLAEGGRSISKTSDGGYLISVFTFSSGEGNSDALLLKTDADGNQQWACTVGGILPDYANSAIETDDGYYLACGFTFSSGAGNRLPFPGYGWWGDRDACLRKVDTSGNLLFEKKYNQASYQQWANAVMETPDHHFLIAGNNDITSSELLNAYLVKTSSEGVKEWSKSYGEGTFYDYGNAIVQGSDSNYLICGTTKSVATWNDIYFLTVNKSGTLLHKVIVGEEGFD